MLQKLAKLTLRRSPVRAATCGVLLLAVPSLGTALALKVFKRKENQEVQ